MFEWDPDKIRFRIDSVQRSTFHQQIARVLAGKYDNPSTVSLCDAGCGLGFLSLALSEHFKQITSIDISPLALSVLQRETASRGIRNINILQEDLLYDPAVVPGLYDGMVFSFFGNVSEIQQIAAPRCHNRIFILKKNDHHHRFSVSHALREHDSMAWALADLRERGLRFTKEDMSIEDGQPLRSLKDADLFFRLYARGEDKNLITRDYIRSLLQETGDDEFPYYYQRACTFSILTVDMSSYNHMQGDV